MQPLVIHPRHSADEPSVWEDVADEVLAAIQPRAEELARKITEHAYSGILSDVQDYLTDNARFNIASRIQTAEREARHLRFENDRLRASGDAVLSVLRELVEIERRDNLTDPAVTATDEHRAATWEAARVFVATPSVGSVGR